MGDLGSALLRLMVSLPLVLLLMYFVLKYGFGKKGFTSSGTLKVVDQIALGNKNYLAVVKVKDNYLLLSVGEKGIELLEEFDDYPEMEYRVGDRIAPSLKQWKSRFLRGYDPNEGDNDEN